MSSTTAADSMGAPATPVAKGEAPLSPTKKRGSGKRRSKQEIIDPKTKKKKVMHFAISIQPDEFHEPDYFYPRVRNATIHPMVATFLRLSNARIARRYCHLHPSVKYEELLKVLTTVPSHFRWAGSDLFLVTTKEGKRQMIVIETNSCPSGQKSMPPLSDEENTDGYHRLMTQFMDMLNSEKKDKLPKGDLAVVYDKNEMEAQGYAAALADASNEKIWRVEFHKDDPDPPVRFNADAIMEIRDEAHNWHPIRAAFRYVTQQPWDRIPLKCKTEILNKIVSCLAGGRNKQTAAWAYSAYNNRMEDKQLAIRFPETIRDVQKVAIPLWVEGMGGMAVIKNPYSNAGQGVYTITSKAELDAFMAMDAKYDSWIVQTLVGNSNWSSHTKKGVFYHCGTVPNAKNQSFIFDLRMMVSATPKGFRPHCVYARSALKPLVENASEITDSWAMLGTNLSIKNADGSWGSDTSRLRLMDRKDFNMLGLGIDDLIDGYVQTVLSVLAIDDLAEKLLPSDGDEFNMDLFASINQDDTLLKEIMPVKT